MNHIIDEDYKGHELVFLQDDDKTITVDIREDNYAGAFLTGRQNFLSVSDARLYATGYIDGYHTLKQDCPHGTEGQLAKARLEYLRAELRAERMSYGEINELMSLIPYIDPGDVELLQAADVPEFPDNCWNCDAVCSEYSEYQDDGRVFCSLDCLNEATAEENLCPVGHIQDDDGRCACTNPDAYGVEV